MADTILTLTQLENLFQSVTSQILGTTDPSAVRIDWPADGAPSWKINDDVCFIRIDFDDDPITRQVETSYEPLDSDNATVNQSSMDVIGVDWIVYGPHSFDNARLIRNKLFDPTYKDILAASNVALVTDIAMPRRVPEFFNGQWWNRTSFSANFNELVVRQSSVPYLQSANVQVKEG